MAAVRATGSSATVAVRLARSSTARPLGATTVSVKLCAATGLTRSDAVTSNVVTDAALAVAAIVAVPSPLSLEPTPFGRVPDSLRDGFAEVSGPGRSTVAAIASSRSAMRRERPG